QLAQVPVLGRNPLQLINVVAGAGFNSRFPLTVNGIRPIYGSVTLDGINIQDQFDRWIDSPADRPFLDQVSEVAVLGSNPSAVRGFGYAHVILTTPRGSNQYHGTLYGQNRNSVFAANNWFNNRDGVERPFLNRSQGGGTLGGPLL